MMLTIADISKAVLWMALMVIGGCTPSSSEEFQQEGATLSKQLIQDLRKISKREELVAALPRLKKRFDSLVTLMIEARLYQESSQDAAENDTVSREISDELMQEFARIYSSIEEGRELMEKAQQEAMLKLDAFENDMKRLR